jgi:hypothetical protein
MKIKIFKFKKNILLRIGLSHTNQYIFLKIHLANKSVNFMKLHF